MLPCRTNMFPACSRNTHCWATWQSARPVVGLPGCRTMALAEPGWQGTLGTAAASPRKDQATQSYRAESHQEDALSHVSFGQSSPHWDSQSWAEDA